MDVRTHRHRHVHGVSQTSYVEGPGKHGFYSYREGCEHDYGSVSDNVLQILTGGKENSQV